VNGLLRLRAPRRRRGRAVAASAGAPSHPVLSDRLRPRSRSDQRGVVPPAACLHMLPARSDKSVDELVVGAPGCAEVGKPARGKDATPHGNSERLRARDHRPPPAFLDPHDLKFAAVRQRCEDDRAPFRPVGAVRLWRGGGVGHHDRGWPAGRGRAGAGRRAWQGPPRRRRFPRRFRHRWCWHRSRLDPRGLWRKGRFPLVTVRRGHDPPAHGRAMRRRRASPSRRWPGAIVWRRAVAAWTHAAHHDLGDTTSRMCAGARGPVTDLRAVPRVARCGAGS
jgi:hypothetical protein